MSWKAVDLQVALPRTQDAGKLQEQQSKHPQHFQEALTADQLKRDLLRRKRVNEYHEARLDSLKDEENKKEETDQQQREPSKKKEEHPSLSHPFLGNAIDYRR